jgi:hypothetical protein
LWCILVAKYGAFLFTEIGAFVITDYNFEGLKSRKLQIKFSRTQMGAIQEGLVI